MINEGRITIWHKWGQDYNLAGLVGVGLQFGMVSGGRTTIWHDKWKQNYSLGHMLSGCRNFRLHAEWGWTTIEVIL